MTTKLTNKPRILANGLISRNCAEINFNLMTKIYKLKLEKIETISSKVK